MHQEKSLNAVHRQFIIILKIHDHILHLYLQVIIVQSNNLIHNKTDFPIAAEIRRRCLTPGEHD